MAPVIEFSTSRKTWRRDAVLVLLAVAALCIGSELALSFGLREDRLYLIVFGGAVSSAAWFAAGRYPRLTLVIVPIVVCGPWWPVERPEPQAVPLLIIAFRAAASGLRRAVLLPLVVYGTLLCLYSPFRSTLLIAGVYSYHPLDDPIPRAMLLALLGVVIVLGYMIHRQREAAQVLVRRDEALKETERERDAAKVRTAVARDLHDTVAHHVSAIVIRAQATLRTSSDDPEALRRTLEAVVADGGEALTSMRRAVTLLRSPDAATTRPQGSPGERLDRAVETVRSTGVAVDVFGALEGPEYAQNALVEVAREALTNVMKHSEGRHVTIDFRHRDGRFHAVVDDEGPARHREGRAPGFGIVGMSERAMSLGGTLRSERTAEGGWRTVMSIPAEETREAAGR